MPEPWITRTLEGPLVHPASALRLFPVWLLLGPRQVGKSSVLQRSALSPREYVDLDNLTTRSQANLDPEFFVSKLKLPLTIDEIQYAPQLLSPIKRLADQSTSAGTIWLSGSQNFQVMKGVHETLAGRVALLNLYGLSDAEKGLGPMAPDLYFAQMIESTFPKLRGVTDPDSRGLYLSSYTQTYIERDVRELLGIQKRREFEIFVRMCALRTGQVVNYDDLARDVGVSAVTVKEWLSLLEDSYLIKLIQPHHSNRTKRLIKSPKLYFLDMGLAAHLAGWSDPEMLRLGPMGGAALETHLFGNIVRYFRHQAKEVQIHFWRTRDGQEIDFLVETGGKVYPIEIKMGTPKVNTLVRLSSISEANWTQGTVFSLSGWQGKFQHLNDEWTLRTPWEFPFSG